MLVVHILLLIVIIIAAINVFISLVVVDTIAEGLWVVIINATVWILIGAIVRTIICLIAVVVSLVINTHILPKLLIRFVQSLSRLGKFDSILL